MHKVLNKGFPLAAVCLRFFLVHVHTCCYYHSNSLHNVNFLSYKRFVSMHMRSFSEFCLGQLMVDVFELRRGLTVPVPVISVSVHGSRCLGINPNPLDRKQA